MRLFCAILLLFSFPALWGETLYWGGPYRFAPLSEEHELRIDTLSLLPVPTHDPDYLLFSVLASSPDANILRRGTLSPGLQRADGRRLTLSFTPRRADDPLYDDDALALTFTLTRTDGTKLISKVEVPHLSAAKLLNGADAMLALGIENGRLTVYGGPSLQLVVWNGTTPPVDEFMADAAPIEYVCMENAGSAYTVSRAAVQYEPPQQVAVLTPSQIQKALAEAAQDPYAGYWALLDYDLDANFLRTGGNYVVALLPDPATVGAYRIIYISGATTEPSRWPSGRLKGSLCPTHLPTAYTARWTDAEGVALPADATAQFLSRSLLTLTFPTLNSSLRFHKINNPSGH